MIKKLWYVISRILIVVGIILLLNYIRYGSIAMPVLAETSGNISYDIPKDSVSNFKSYNETIYSNFADDMNGTLSASSVKANILGFTQNYDDMSNYINYNYQNNIPFNQKLDFPITSSSSDIGDFIYEMDFSFGGIAYFELKKDNFYTLLIEIEKSDDLWFYSMNNLTTDNTKMYFSNAGSGDSSSSYVIDELQWITSEHKNSIDSVYGYFLVRFHLSDNVSNFETLYFNHIKFNIINDFDDMSLYHPQLFKTSTDSGKFRFNSISFIENGYASPNYLYHISSSGGGFSSGGGRRENYTILNQDEVGILDAIQPCGSLDIACHINNFYSSFKSFINGLFIVNFGASDFQMDSTNFVTELVLLPLSFLTHVYDSSTIACQPYNFGALFGTSIIFPCFQLSNFLGNNVSNLIDDMLCLFMLYNIAMLIIYFIEKWTSLDDTFFLLYSPQHFGPDSESSDYQPKHARR